MKLTAVFLLCIVVVAYALPHDHMRFKQRKASALDIADTVNGESQGQDQTAQNPEEDKQKALEDEKKKKLAEAEKQTAETTPNSVQDPNVKKTEVQQAEKAEKDLSQAVPELEKAAKVEEEAKGLEKKAEKQEEQGKPQEAQKTENKAEKLEVLGQKLEDKAQVKEDKANQELGQVSKEELGGSSSGMAGAKGQGQGQQAAQPYNERANEHGAILRVVTETETKINPATGNPPATYRIRSEAFGYFSPDTDLLEPVASSAEPQKLHKLCAKRFKKLAEEFKKAGHGDLKVLVGHLERPADYKAFCEKLKVTHPDIDCAKAEKDPALRMPKETGLDFSLGAPAPFLPLKAKVAEIIATPSYGWLKDNAYKYGITRFDEDKQPAHWNCVVPRNAWATGEEFSEGKFDVLVEEKRLDNGVSIFDDMFDGKIDDKPVFPGQEDDVQNQAAAGSSGAGGEDDDEEETDDTAASSSGGGSPPETNASSTGQGQSAPAQTRFRQLYKARIDYSLRRHK